MTRPLTSYSALFGLSVCVHLSACCETAQADAPLPLGYVHEAPLPEGFPPPSEVGKVVEKEYPIVRSYSATGRGAFMQCFGYLAKQKHEMTAPVVMEYGSDKGGQESEPLDDEMPVHVKRMHFLLEKSSQDEPKQVGPVIVADMPKMRVLSIAYQGRLSKEVVQGAEDKLTQQLAARPELVSAGSTRILGYNGPTVPPDKVFWEVQLPVKAAKDK